MTGNAHFTFNDVGVVALCRIEAPVIVTSEQVDERLAPFYERTGNPPGLLKRLAGVNERRQWEPGFSFAEASAAAGGQAIAEAGIDPGQIGLVVDSSVCKARLEPSTAVTVHNLLGLPSHCLNYDVGNACLGFVNGMHLAGMMIDSGQIDYALIVDGEGTREIYDNTINELNQSGQHRDDFSENFATLTLGSGAAAMVLGKASTNDGSHPLVKGYFRADSSHHELCVGTLEHMRTDARALLDAGCSLVKLSWDQSDFTDWEHMDRYILHQVSRVHTAAVLDVLNIDSDRCPLTFPNYGNIGPAAIPFTLAHTADSLQSGDRVLCMGIGSGLNTGVLELNW